MKPRSHVSQMILDIIYRAGKANTQELSRLTGMASKLISPRLKSFAVRGLVEIADPGVPGSRNHPTVWAKPAHATDAKAPENPRLLPSRYTTRCACGRKADLVKWSQGVCDRCHRIERALHEPTIRRRSASPNDKYRDRVFHCFGKLSRLATI